MGRLRIIAGALKGRRIRVPPDGVRPTPDRVREALFSILGGSLPDYWRVLDLYAGAGAVGFEALSRGARYAVLVERDAAAARQLTATARELGLQTRARIVRGDALEQLAGLAAEGAFELIFADPPYPEADPAALVARVAATGALRAGGWLVFQRPREKPPGPPESGLLRLERTASYGRTCLDIYRTCI